MSKPPVRVAVLISGTGSNLRALVEGAGDAYAVALVLSNKTEAPGLAWAAGRGIATLALAAFLYHRLSRDPARRVTGP